ncbi:hypothetical protein A0J57_18645 [Sphingobium sp. 22B]|nr:hypothetical protein AXW74_23080 [Sphingobium sp. AM]KYC30876.1 hypothetical protein A0J57_18645 [Sphingobium sp. 22B]OAP29396.1 hypothetical protein A8O16_23945 [Sphingobium sp. 20006FA]
MASVAAPVSIMTSYQDGIPYGTTVSAFSSLSMDPPMVLACLDRRSKLLAPIRATGTFALNVLGTDHHRLVRSFASREGDRFAGVEWRLQHGVPQLQGVLSWIGCDVESLIAAGDHVVVIGLVRQVINRTGSPLTYYSRSLGTHTDLSELQAA